MKAVDVGINISFISPPPFNDIFMGVKINWKKVKHHKGLNRI